MIVERIAHSVDLPVTVDFEGGYADDPAQLAINTSRLIEGGVVGINFEDQVVGGTGLHTVSKQVARITAIRNAADTAGVPLFINVCTGADGFFVPGLTDRTLVRKFCERCALPVNVLMARDLDRLADMETTGVARISFGPAPYFRAMKDMVARFDAVGR